MHSAATQPVTAIQARIDRGMCTREGYVDRRASPRKPRPRIRCHTRTYLCLGGDLGPAQCCLKLPPPSCATIAVRLAQLLRIYKGAVEPVECELDQRRPSPAVRAGIHPDPRVFLSRSARLLEVLDETT